MSIISKEILNRLEKIAPASSCLHEPTFNGNEWNYVKQCIDTNWVSSVGKFVDRFEAMLAEITGASYVTAIVNGTSALHLALQIAGVKKDDEVLMPAMTFVATANAVIYCNAIPHFVDISQQTLGIDSARMDLYLSENAEKREDGTTWNKNTNQRISACIPMHCFGHPVAMTPLNDVCKKWNITIIEDAAEALGSYYQQQHVGNIGKLSIISFNGNKITTTGGGGAILTNDQTLAQKAKHLSTTAKIAHPFEIAHDEIGFNYRMPNINAALGCAQLETLPNFLQQKRVLAKQYQTLFNDMSEVNIFNEPAESRSNYWLNTLILKDQYSALRNEIIELTNTHKIMTRPAWNLLPELTMYQHCPSMNLPIAKDLQQRIVCLPSTPGLELN